MSEHAPELVDTVVIGGGQAGLAIGAELARRGREFVILDAGDRVGDAWRLRWDSLRLFTPGKLNGLPGMPFPGDPLGFASKDEVADYLEGYARALALPVRTGIRVDRVWREGDRFGLSAGDRVEVRSRVGAVTVALEVTDDMGLGVVSLPHGWGHDRDGTRLSVARQFSGVSVNDVTNEFEVDTLSGTAAFNGLPVRVTRLGFE